MSSPPTRDVIQAYAVVTATLGDWWGDDSMIPDAALAVFEALDEAGFEIRRKQPTVDRQQADADNELRARAEAEWKWPGNPYHSRMGTP